MLSAQQEGLKIIYLFDTSGTFQGEALKTCVEIGDKFFNKAISQKSSEGLDEWPQTHVISLIDHQSIKIKGWNKCEPIIVPKPPTFKKSSDIANAKKNFNVCMKKILNEPTAMGTDITGALISASNGLQSKKLFGKGIIIFSDLKEEYSPYAGTKVKLNGISVYIVYDYPRDKIDPKEMQNNIAKLEDFLTSAGVKNIEFKHTASTDPEDITDFFYNSFNK